MKLRTTIISAALLCIAQFAAAADFANVHEAHAASITLPERGGNIVTVHACTVCPVYRVAITDNTVFEVGSLPVSLAEMRAALVAQPATLVLLQATADDRQLLLMSIAAPEVR